MVNLKKHPTGCMLGSKKKERRSNMKNAKHFCLFLSGMFLAFDFTGMLGKCFFSQQSSPERKSDRDNSASDWQKAGDALRKAMKMGKDGNNVYLL